MLGFQKLLAAFSTLVFLVASTIVLADEADSGLLTPIRELDPTKHRSQLRKALFGGSPSIIMCQPAKAKNKKPKGGKGKKKNTKDAAATDALGGAELDSYVSQVQQKLGGAAVQIIVSECYKPLGGDSSNNKSVLKALNLVERPGLPTVVWAAHGDKPIQLTHEQLATAIKGKDGKPTGQARLDAGKLARYSSKNAGPRVNVVKSALDFQDRCLSLKHQRCALFMHAGALSDDSKKVFKALAGNHRDYRFMAADTTSFEFSIAEKLPEVTTTQPRLVVFQRRVGQTPFAMVTRGQQALPDTSHDQMKKGADESTCTDVDSTEHTDEDCNLDKQVDEKRHIVTVSKALGDLIKLSSNASIEAINAAFEKNVLDSHRDYNKLHAQSTAPGQLTPAQRKELVFKISVKASSDTHQQVYTKRAAYLLDWTAMESYFVSHTVYGKGLNIGKLALLQQDTWKRVHERQNSLAKKRLAVNAKAFRKDGLVLAKGQSEASQFLNDISKGALKPLPLNKVPVLKSTKKKKPSPAKTKKKATGGGAPASYKNGKKKTSGSSKFGTKVKPPTKRTGSGRSRTERERKAKGRKAGQGGAGLSAEQVELERQHRLEMDREAQQHYAEFDADADEDGSSGHATTDELLFGGHDDEDEEDLDLDDDDEDDEVDDVIKNDVEDDVIDGDDDVIDEEDDDDDIDDDDDDDDDLDDVINADVNDAASLDDSDF